MTLELERVLPVTTVKRRFLELLTRLGKEGGVLTVTRNGTPAGVVMSTEEYEALLETLEILADASVARSVDRARKRLARGRGLSHDEVWQDVQ